MRKEAVDASTSSVAGDALLPLEKQLLLLLDQYPEIVQQAALEHNPASVANYIYSVAQLFNTFYTAHSVLKAESGEKKQLRLRLSQLTATTIKEAMHLLGIRVPERM